MVESINNDGYLFPVPIEQTEAFIEEHIQEISSVKELTGRMGYSRSYFCIRVKEHYGITASELLREERFDKVKTEILKHPNETSDAIAGRSGLNGGCKRLYKFLSNHWDTNFTELRRELINS